MADTTAVMAQQNFTTNIALNHQQFNGLFYAIWLSHVCQLQYCIRLFQCEFIILDLFASSRGDGACLFPWLVAGFGTPKYRKMPSMLLLIPMPMRKCSKNLPFSFVHLEY